MGFIGEGVIEGSCADKHQKREDAVKAVCDALDHKSGRKAFLLMTAGPSKTRMVIGLDDVWLQHGWGKNILFPKDRNSPAIQAKRGFVNLRRVCP